MSERCSSVNSKKVKKASSHLMPSSSVWQLQWWWWMIVVLLGSEVSSAGYTDERLSELRETVKGMFYHGWDNYLDVAYPLDELKPISCGGMGRDYRNENTIGPNDVLGDYSLTLIDSLDTLAILGDKEGFKQALNLVKARIKNFDIPSTVQVFEVTIRIMGGLLSSHIYATDPTYGMVIDDYDGFLLNLAKDLGDRLMPAFNTPTGIPSPRVNLRYSNLLFSISETCAAGSGSLVLEFSTLSRLTGDDKYEKAAKRGFFEIWDRRSPFNLVGTSIDSQTGMWLYPLSGIGASADSFYEYAVKSYVLLGEEEFLNVSKLIMESVDEYLLDNWIYRNIHLESGSFLNGWIDALSSFFPGLQVLYGNLSQAIRSYMIYYKLWMEYGAIPERWEAIPGHPQVTFAWYPLRPEFIESTYLLYQSTKDPFYLYVGEQIINDIEILMKTNCGFAGLNDIETGSLDDRMESFFLSETVKYLYLLFTPDHVLNHDSSGAVFSTEAHLMKIPHNDNITKRGVSSDSSTVCEIYPPRKVQQYGMIEMYSKVLSWDKFDHLDAIFHYPSPCEAPAFINQNRQRNIIIPPLSDPLATCAPVEWTTQYDIQFSYKDTPTHEEEVQVDYRQDAIKTKWKRSQVVRVANGDLEAPSFDGLRLVLRQQRTNSPVPLSMDTNINIHPPPVQEEIDGVRILSVDGLPLGTGRRLRVTDLDRLDFDYNDILDIGEDGRVYFRGQSIINLALST